MIEELNQLLDEVPDMVTTIDDIRAKVVKTPETLEDLIQMIEFASLDIMSVLQINAIDLHVLDKSIKLTKQILIQTSDYIFV